MLTTIKCPNCDARIDIEIDEIESQGAGPPSIALLIDTQELAALIADQLEMRWRE